MSSEELGSLTMEDAVISGLLCVGVVGLEIQTPSTSIPLSMARMPKGISLALRRLMLSAWVISRFRRASCFFAAIAVYLRSLQCVYASFRHPRRIVTTCSSQLCPIDFALFQDLLQYHILGTVHTISDGPLRFQFCTVSLTKHIFSHRAHEVQNAPTMMTVLGKDVFFEGVDV